MQKLLLVGAGGFIGAVLRYTVSGFVHNLVKGIGFPYGTLAVNLIGCLLIGFCLQLDEMRNFFPAQVRLALFVGIFGSFTTYSTFGSETFNMMHARQYGIALLNVGGHIVFGLVFVWLGRMSGYFLWR